MMEVNTKRMRRPRTALTASLVVPGLGQIYNGEATKGLSMMLIAAFMVPIFAWIAVNAPASLMSFFIFFGVAIALGVFAFAAIDAYKAASRIGENFSPTPFNTPYSYLALVFFAYFFIFGQLNHYTRENLVSAYSFPTTSMTPGILAGDRFFADKTINKPGAKQRIKRGEIVVFVNPNDRTQTFAKRVVGLPGDRVEIAANSIKVNDRSLTSSVVTNFENDELNKLLADHVAFREQADGNEYVAIWHKNEKQGPQSFIVPNGQIFVLGDNRDSTMDSRRFGTVPLNDVIGRAEQVWFSTRDNGIRWGRIGTLLTRGG